jgi:ketosteroid isomerase-like protein
MLILAISGLLLSPPAFAADDSETEVKAAAARFYSALNTMFTGELSPMKEVWSHASDVTYMGPGGGFQVGWDKVLVEWQKQAALKYGGSVEPKAMQVIAGKDLAVVQNYEEGTNTNVNGKEAKVSLRATNVFRKEDGKWKMVSHHTDLFSSRP